MDETPFKDVYFTSILRDVDGKKLSKSLGNSPDPIKLFDEYGTDAVRFSIMLMAPQGLDVLFSKDRLEIGRNFMNKFWNACRFIEMNLDTDNKRDLDFDNLSRGERNRLILGMSWSFRDVWESLYQNINLLFIDELVDSGMDANGVENAIAVLKKMGRERQKNIYLISHKEELASRVTNVLKVIKENGFTSYDNDVEVMT